MQDSMYRRGGNNMHFYLLDSAQKFWKELCKKLITMIACGWLESRAGQQGSV